MGTHDNQHFDCVQTQRMDFNQWRGGPGRASLNLNHLSVAALL
jgi:hypothetical protein